MRLGDWTSQANTGFQAENELTGLRNPRSSMLRVQIPDATDR